MTENNILLDKSIAFAISIVNCFNYLKTTKKNDYETSC